MFRRLNFEFWSVYVCWFSLHQLGLCASFSLFVWHCENCLNMFVSFVCTFSVWFFNADDTYYCWFWRHKNANVLWRWDLERKMHDSVGSDDCTKLVKNITNCIKFSNNLIYTCIFLLLIFALARACITFWGAFFGWSLS